MYKTVFKACFHYLTSFDILEGFGCVWGRHTDTYNIVANFTGNSFFYSKYAYICTQFIWHLESSVFNQYCDFDLTRSLFNK